jgi:hypothetical protein
LLFRSNLIFQHSLRDARGHGIIELLYRNLQEVFGEGDAARRRAAIEDFYTEDCVLYVPPGVFVGHDALDKFAGDLRATHPQFVYTHHGEPQALHNGGILRHGAQARKARPLTTPDWMSSLFAMARSLRSTSFSIPNLHSGRGTLRLTLAFKGGSELQEASASAPAIRAGRAIWHTDNDTTPQGYRLQTARHHSRLMSGTGHFRPKVRTLPPS